MNNKENKNYNINHPDVANRITSLIGSGIDLESIVRTLMNEFPGLQITEADVVVIIDKSRPRRMSAEKNKRQQTAAIKRAAKKAPSKKKAKIKNQIEEDPKL